MRLNNIITVFSIIGCISLSSCSIVKSGAHSNNAYQTPETKIRSYNEYDLNISSNSISYTIDISTPEGKAKLNKLSLKEAENLALTEAVMKNGCALLVNPQFTNLMKGKQVLRITVHGFPAKYKESK